MSNFVFYHGTSLDNWNRIQQEGVLWGRRYYIDNNNKTKEISRCTYLAVDKKEAECYGDVLLEVKYNPYKDKHNNYTTDCWQLRVYTPIPIENVKRIK